MWAGRVARKANLVPGHLWSHPATSGPGSQGAGGIRNFFPGWRDGEQADDSQEFSETHIEEKWGDIPKS